MKFYDMLFMSNQFILMGRKKYDKIFKNCESFKDKNGENYTYHFVFLYLGYYKGDYDLSYHSFYWLVQNKKIKQNLINWGVKLFIEKVIILQKNYGLAASRVNELLKLNTLNELQKKKLMSIQSYLQNIERTQTAKKSN